MNAKESMQVLLEALHKLDKRLAADGIGSLELKIVGGFALIAQGVRDNGFTQDIDSMTRGFSSEVNTAIAEVGRDMGIKLGWLNADMVLDDPEIIEGIVGKLEFKPFDEFQVIKACLADLPSLLRLKIVAAGDNLEITNDDIEFERHYEDVLALIKAMNLDTLASVKQTAPIIADYPELEERLFGKTSNSSAR